jgi:hypothetical protein
LIPKIPSMFDPNERLPSKRLYVFMFHIQKLVFLKVISNILKSVAAFNLKTSVEGFFNISQCWCYSKLKKAEYDEQHQ